MAARLAEAFGGDRHVGVLIGIPRLVPRLTLAVSHRDLRLQDERRRHDCGTGEEPHDEEEASEAAPVIMVKQGTEAVEDKGESVGHPKHQGPYKYSRKMAFCQAKIRVKWLILATLCVSVSKDIMVQNGVGCSWGILACTM